MVPPAIWLFSRLACLTIGGLYMPEKQDHVMKLFIQESQTNMRKKMTARCQMSRVVVGFGRTRGVVRVHNWVQNSRLVGNEVEGLTCSKGISYHFE